MMTFEFLKSKLSLALSDGMKRWIGGEIASRNSTSKKRNDAVIMC